MSTETSPRVVRFSPEELKSPRLPSLALDADPDNNDQIEDAAALSASVSSINGRPPRDYESGYTNGVAPPTPRPQRPLSLMRTPSNTYAPQRKPQTQPTFNDSMRSQSKSRMRPNDRLQAQNQAYVQRLRQNQNPNYEYFGESYQSTATHNDSDSEGETPSSEGPFDDRYDQETIMFYGDDELQPTEEDLKDAVNRERLEWCGMLEAVLFGDVMKQEKKRQSGSTDTQGGKTAQKDIWVGIRAKVCGRHLPVQKRMVEDGRGTLDKLLDEIINFQIKGFSEVGKSPQEQVKDVVQKMEKCEILYPSWKSLTAEHKTAASPLFQEAWESIISWHNTNEMINTELSILKKWVGNDDMDFSRPKSRSPSGSELSDEGSFLDRIMKEDGLKTLYYVDEDDSSEKGMLAPISAVINKAKQTLIRNYAAFQKRHLPPYIEELLTLISFPSRLIEEIIKMRLTDAKKFKESTQQNPLTQKQLITQFQDLLQLAIRIKNEYSTVIQPEPGWDLPPCIDESFDQVVLSALKHYFKVLNWRLSGIKNTFKEAELLFLEWDFANRIGGQLQGGDIEVAEQFSSLTYKALSRLSLTFERELHVRAKETVSEMSKRYAQMLDSVRVRQRMLQRFSRDLSANYENASDLSIAWPADLVHEFYDRLISSGHFQVFTEQYEQDGIFIIASPNLQDRPEHIQALMGITSQDQFTDDSGFPYLLIMRPENPPQWYGPISHISLREQNIDLKKGHIRLCACGSRFLPETRRIFLDAVNMHVDLVVEQRSNLHRVNNRLMETRKVAYKLSNTFMDSVETIRKQMAGKDCQELIQTCFVFATEFGRRSLLAMDSNRRQMNNMKLTKLALDWVGFICDDCMSVGRKSFKWAVAALEFAFQMTRGRHILTLGEEEYAKLRTKVGGCMALLISHFDIMGARSTLALRAERERTDALMGQFRRLGKNLVMDDEDAFKSTIDRRIVELEKVDEVRRDKAAGQQALGRVLEAHNEVDRSLAWLSSAATNVTMRWQLGQFVGGGTFGNVYSAVNLESGQVMAVKEIRLQDPKLIPTIAEQIKDEMGVLEILDHPNVVSYYGIEVHRDRVYIFMEFCSGGSLANLLEHGRIEDEQVIMVYALQLLEGLVYLHESGIAHRDIKPENILLDHNGIIKYVDFGAAKVIARQGRTLAAGILGTKRNRSMTGTPMYMAPEAIKSEDPGRTGAVDVWSLGCVILEMATGRAPWAHLDNEWAIMYHIAQGDPPHLPTPDQLSPRGIDFLQRCFAPDPKDRASSAELLQHEWIMTVRSQMVEPATPSDTTGSAHSTPLSSSMRSSVESFY